MATSPLYPDCDFEIWFRTTDENHTTIEPIEGHQTGERMNILELLNSVAIGIIPDWINGCLYQNGPGLLDVTGERVEHLFDAFALIQKYWKDISTSDFYSSNRFTIKNGYVTYQNRVLQSDAYQQASRTGQRFYSEYGTSTTKKISNTSEDENLSQSTLSWFYSR